MKMNNHKPVSLAVAIGSILATQAVQAGGNTITVNTTDDGLDQAGVCTLRDAIRSANAGASYGGCASGSAGQDSIEFSVTGTIALDAGLPYLLVTDDVIISGPGPASLTIGGDPQGTVLGVYDVPGSAPVGDFQISGLTLTGGNPQNGGGLFLFADNAVVSDVVITGNTAQSNDNNLGRGGGIYAFLPPNASLLIEDSVISNNEALTTASPVRGFGAGIFINALNSGSSTVIRNTEISGNDSAWRSGGLEWRGDDSIIELDSVIIDDNDAAQAYGGARLYSLAGSGPGPHVLISDSEITNNEVAGGFGFALAIGAINGTQAVIEDSLIDGNSAPGATGAGLTVIGTGPTSAPSGMRVSRTTLSGNSAGQSGGMYVFGSGSNQVFDMVVESSTISNNSASLWGGGVSMVLFTGDDIRFENTTISGNYSGGSGLQNYGAGVQVFGSGTAELSFDHVTITDNSSDASTGGVNVDNMSGQVTFRNSLVAGNSCQASSGCTDDLRMRTTSGFGEVDLFYNLIGDQDGFNPSAASTGNLFAIDPELGPLADNGGPTLTHALLPGSPAIDSGDPAFTPPPAFDQRGPGFDRVRGAAIDIGAYERQVDQDLSLDPAALNFGSVDVGDTGGPLASTLSNDGSSGVLIESITGPGTFPVDFSDCSATLPFTLAASDDCQLQVTFQPASPGPDSGVIVVSGDGGAQTVSLAVQGTGVDPATGPVIDVDPDALAFGNVPVNDSSMLATTISNLGDEDLVVDFSISNFTPLGGNGGNAFSITGGDCGLSGQVTLPPNQACDLEVTFAPLTAGPDSADLELTSNDVNLVVPLTGTGIEGFEPEDPIRIPTLNRIGLMLTAAGIGLLGLIGLRRRNTRTLQHSSRSKSS